MMLLLLCMLICSEQCMGAASIRRELPDIMLPGIGRIYEPKAYAFEGSIISTKGKDDSAFQSVPGNHMFELNEVERKLLVKYPIDGSYRAALIGQDWSYLTGPKKCDLVANCICVLMDKNYKVYSNTVVEDEDLDSYYGKNTLYERWLVLSNGVEIKIDLIALKNVYDEFFRKDEVKLTKD